MNPSMDTNATFPPTKAPTSYRQLHFICKYKDNKDFITTYLSLSSYADILKNIILNVIPSFLLHPIEYNETDSKSLATWKRGGIIDFLICNIFDSELGNIDFECPSYSLTTTEDDTYSAIGIFAIVADEAISSYQDRITEIMISSSFQQKCSENMNERLNNETNNGRRLLSYDSFDIISVEIIDPQNYTILDEEMLNGGNDNMDINVVLLIVGSIMMICIIIGCIIFYLKKRQKTETIKEHTEGGMVGHEHGVEMKEIDREIHGEVEGVGDNGNTANEQEAILVQEMDEMDNLPNLPQEENNELDEVKPEDDIRKDVGGIHKTHGYQEEDNLDVMLNDGNPFAGDVVSEMNNYNTNNTQPVEGDIIDAIKKTHGNFEEDNMIIEAINDTSMGGNDNAFSYFDEPLS